MKIGSNNIPSPPPTADAAASGATREGGTARAAGGTSSQDTVTLSATGSKVSALASSSDFDANKVEAIRQAIRDGKFSVNAEAIADRLISEATALLGPRTH